MLFGAVEFEPHFYVFFGRVCMIIMMYEGGMNLGEGVFFMILRKDEIMCCVYQRRGKKRYPIPRERKRKRKHY